MVKKGKKILWRAVEMPSKLVLKESFFEEDIKPVVKFQNKIRLLVSLVSHLSLIAEMRKKDY